MRQNDTALNATMWEKGACFWQMGYHYWRYMSIDMDCNDTYPIFLLYNGGKLNAWGIALAHHDRPYLSSYRWEHPGGSELDYFFQSGQIPTCLPNDGTLSTQHIFLTNAAYNVKCIHIFHLYLDYKLKAINGNVSDIHSSAHCGVDDGFGNYMIVLEYIIYAFEMCLICN